MILAKLFKNTTSSVADHSGKAVIRIFPKGYQRRRKYVLIIYIDVAVRHFFIEGRRKINNTHSMYWESIEIVRALNENGYTVDFADCMAPLPELEWTKYDIVIDERNSIYNKPVIRGQQRIFYCTGCHWLFHNRAELKRVKAFEERYGLVFPPMRQIEPLQAEAVADMITYFGGDFQQALFTHPAKTFPLALSSTFIPDFKEKEIIKSRQNILWLGSRGFIHKGLDIVLEAFKLLKDFNLHICTNLEVEPGFYDWFKKEFSHCANIHYHGWKDVNDPGFQQLAENCIASVYCSAAEGGAGAIIQAMQFGCIPIVNDSTALRGQDTGFYLKGQAPMELINSIQEVLNNMAAMPDVELGEKSVAVRTYANKNHSREAYSKSFRQLIHLLNG